LTFPSYQHKPSVIWCSARVVLPFCRPNWGWQMEKESTASLVQCDADGSRFSAFDEVKIPSFVILCGHHLIASLICDLHFQYETENSGDLEAYKLLRVPSLL